MATAHEREQELAPAVGKALTLIGELEQAVAAAEQRSHDAYVEGNVSAGDAGQDEVLGLRPQLEAARARLEGLAQAGQILAAERQRDVWAAELAALEQAVSDAGNEAARHYAEIGPLASALKQKIRLARQAEETGNRADQRRHVLACELDGTGREANGLRYLPSRSARFTRTTALLERSPTLRAVDADPDY